MSRGQELRARVDARLTADAESRTAAGDVVCPACTSSSWVRIIIEQHRHEISLAANAAFPLKDDSTIWDETKTEQDGWFCGVCQAPAATDLVPALDALLARARLLED